MKKRKSKRFRLLLEDLRYWQGMYKVERRSLKKTEEKIKKIAKEMRDALEV